MIACVDVDYREKGAVAACVLFRAWTDEVPAAEHVCHLEHVEPYQPGQFYKRELPCLLAVLAMVPPLETVIVDGYVWLADESQPGLGGHLYEALGKSVPVVGVAKTCFASARAACQCCAATVGKPLFVTAAGAAVEDAARLVQAMHGDFRIPTLLKRVDQLCRTS